VNDPCVELLTECSEESDNVLKNYA